MAFKSDLEALILGVLGEGALHGYEIAKRIRAVSEETLKVGEGRLYPALHKLEESGMIVAEWVQQEGKPARKVYALTPKGKKGLEDQSAAWAKFVTRVDAIMRPKKSAKVDLHG
jgi:transcriptional regulator